MAKNKGKFIVIEGIDGTGKSTQAKLLYNYLKKQKIPAVLTSFPRYKSAWGKMVRAYLDGEFGTLAEVSPRLASALYAGDRLLASFEINKWLAEGKVVVCDRYAASNVAHQAGKFKDAKARREFVSWLENLEYVENKIPKPDAVILLTIPTNMAQKFMKKRKMDIHETGVSYQAAVADAFLAYAKAKKNWIKVSNVNGEKLKGLKEVSEEVVAILKAKKFI